MLFPGHVRDEKLSEVSVCYFSELIIPLMLLRNFSEAFTSLSNKHNYKTFMKSPASWLSSRNLFLGAKSIVMQISFVMLIFLLFLDQISGGAKVSKGGKLPQGGTPLPPVEESQHLCCITSRTFLIHVLYLVSAVIL